MHRRQFLSATAAMAALPLVPTLARGADAKPDHVVTPGPGMASLLGDGKPGTAVWAYGGRVPGPVIRLPRAKLVHLRLDNNLPEPTSVHWHGIRIANAMDGVSGLTQAPVPPGGTFDYRFQSPDAGTYWYHSHHRAWEQVARGLYGLLIVEEDTPPAVDSDHAFIADDWRLDEDGAISAPFGAIGEAAHGGRLGNWLTVNGRTEPVFKVRPGERIRLRCVSAANARIMAFAFPGLTPSVIAVDGQPLEAPFVLDGAMTLGPAQRIDLAIDIPVDVTGPIPIQEVSTADAIKAASFGVSGPPMRERTLTTELVLPANPLPRNLDLPGAINVDLLMEGGAMGGLRQASYKGQMFDMRTLVMEKGQAWAFNGVAGGMDTPLLSAAQGRTVTINMINDTQWPHAMHLHGHHFHVIERDGKPAMDHAWRDTELVEPGSHTRIAFIADNPGKWLFHCHMLEHHMAGMGTWIEVG